MGQDEVKEHSKLNFLITTSVTVSALSFISFLGFLYRIFNFFFKFLAIKSFSDVAVYNISSKPGVSFYLPDISSVSFFT